MTAPRVGGRAARLTATLDLAGCTTTGAAPPVPVAAAAPIDCGFAVAFSRTDEGGDETIEVYEGTAEPAPRAAALRLRLQHVADV